MNIIVVDFETYYSKEYSLSKMTTEEYVRDPRFEVIGVAVKVNDGETEWASGTHEQLKEYLEGFPWADSMMVAHNCMFDGFILTERFGIKSKAYADTLSMGRALHGVEVGNSLAALAERYGIGKKGTEVLNAIGKRRADFDAGDLERYGDYCVNDVELTHKLFHMIVANGFPKTEMRLIDLTLRMFVEPKLDLDLPLLEQHLQDTKNKKERLLEDAGVDKSVLASNPQFAELLRSFGVEPPMKVSAVTGNEAYAFAKTDPGFKALAEHPDVRVQALVAARLGTKSTLEETRTERFIGISNRGLMPVPLKYYAAHTGRWGGSDGSNLQNLPSRGENANKLKKAIIAPEGYLIIDADSSQIEARVLAWLAGQDDLVEAFAKGEDVYKIMASAIYDKSIEDITTGERFVGKTTILGCIAEGTLVLSGSGWKPIEQVSLSDKLWDGEEWVCHQGLLNKGLKETVNLCGAWLTPDHKVLCGTTWLETQSVVADENSLYQALDTGAANLPLQATSGDNGVEHVQVGEALQNCKRKLQTYDLAYAGPRNRFTILTSEGPVIVHNCGYGMGAEKFRAQLKTFGVVVTENEAQHIINVYRSTYPKIVVLWREAQTALEALSKGMTADLGKPGVLSLVPSQMGIELPSGLIIRYDELTATRNEENRIQYQYKTRNGWTKIYGGKVVENFTQGVARCIVGEQMIKISKRYPVVLTVHDAIACLVPEAEVEEAQRYVESCMRWTPDWADGLPVNCESGYGRSYGDC